MYVPDVEPKQGGEGLYTIEGEFYTHDYVIWGQVSGPDVRLSDYLNTSLSIADIRIFHVEHAQTRRVIELPGAHARVNKSGLLFVLPVKEPNSPGREENVSWQWKMTRRCWIAAGRYSIVGSVPVDGTKDPKVMLHSLEERQFHPITGVAINFPDGTVRDYPTVIVNASCVDVFALTAPQ